MGRHGQQLCTWTDRFDTHGTDGNSGSAGLMLGTAVYRALRGRTGVIAFRPALSRRYRLHQTERKISQNSGCGINLSANMVTLWRDLAIFSLILEIELKPCSRPLVLMPPFALSKSRVAYRTSHLVCKPLWGRFWTLSTRRAGLTFAIQHYPRRQPMTWHCNNDAAVGETTKVRNRTQAEWLRASNTDIDVYLESLPRRLTKHVKAVYGTRRNACEPGRVYTARLAKRLLCDTLASKIPHGAPIFKAKRQAHELKSCVMFKLPGQSQRYARYTCRTQL
jgi:hypothetical protein